MMHTLSMALRLALRELRSGLQGFRIFLACLILGVSAIAVVGALSSALNTGIANEGRSLMGGDVEFSTLYDTPSSDQRSFIAAAGQVSKVATLRAMAAVPDKSSTLVEVKVVDNAYPLYGRLQLDPAMSLGDALQTDASGRAGTVVETALLARLDIKVGDIVRVGTSDLVINAAIVREPDRISDGFVLGPRLMISTDALAATGLSRPGSLIKWRYRVALPQPANDRQVKRNRFCRTRDGGCAHARTQPPVCAASSTGLPFFCLLSVSPRSLSAELGWLTRSRRFWNDAPKTLQH